MLVHTLAAQAKAKDKAKAKAGLGLRNQKKMLDKQNKKTDN